MTATPVIFASDEVKPVDDAKQTVGAVAEAKKLPLSKKLSRAEVDALLAKPNKPKNLAFAGKDKKTLYVVGRGAAYIIPFLSEG